MCTVLSDTKGSPWQRNTSQLDTRIKSLLLKTAIRYVSLAANGILVSGGILYPRTILDVNYHPRIFSDQLKGRCMMIKENQLTLFQNQLQLIEKKVHKTISAVTQLEKFLRKFETQYAKDGKNVEKYSLLLEELERAVKSLGICGLIFQIYYVADTNQDFTFFSDSDGIIQSVNEEVL